MVDPAYAGPWPAGGLIASNPQGATVATWQGTAWALTDGRSAGPGKLSATLGYVPTIRGAGQLAGVYWDPTTGSYRRGAVQAAGTAAGSLSTLIPEQYGGGSKGYGGTIGTAVGSIVGGIYGGQQGGQAVGQVGDVVGQGVQAGVGQLVNLFS